MQAHAIDGILESLGDLSGAQPPPPVNGQRHNVQTFDLERWIADHGIQTRGKMPYQGGFKWQIQCPFDSSHTSPDACLYQLPNGALGAKCSHTSCAHRRWPEFRQHYEPGCYDQKPDWDRTSRQHHGFDEDEESPVVPLTRPRSMQARLALNRPLRMPVIDRLLREGEVANLISESKVGKAGEQLT